MKILKIIFVFAFIGMIAVSCKETKKEEVQEDTSVEMTEENSGMDATEGDNSLDASGEESSDSEGSSADEPAAAGAAKTVGESAASEPEAEVLEAEEVAEVEELVVPQGVIAEELADTPVIYPGCSGSDAEIRACNKESFIAFLKKEFNHDIGQEVGLKRGDYEIRTIVHIDKTGKLSALRVTAPDNNLKIEMKRVIAKVPQVVPATEGGEPVAVTFILPVDFRVDKL